MGKKHHAVRSGTAGRSMDAFGRESAQPVPAPDRPKTTPAFDVDNQAACFGRPQQPAAPQGLPPITVLVASCRDMPFDALPPALAREHGVCMLADRVMAPALLLARLQRYLPDVLLLDKAIYDGLEAQSLRLLPARFPELRVLLLGDDLRPGLWEEILRNHFHGLLLGSCSLQACLKAVRAVSQGELWLPRALLSKAIWELMGAGLFGDATDDGRHTERGGALTRRESEIVEFLRQGLTNKEIAHRLGVMEDTVKKHLQGVFGKLGVRRRALVALNQALQPPHVARALPRATRSGASV